MKTTPFLRPWTCCLLMLGLLLPSFPAAASEGFRIPPPPSPKKVIRDVRGFIHRVAHGVKDAGKQTWNAIRDPFVDDEEEVASRPRPSQRQATPELPPRDRSSFSRSKESVPYRYDDADNFEARTKPAPSPDRVTGPEQSPPKVNVTPRKNDLEEPATSKPDGKPPTRKPFMAPEEAPPPSNSSPASTESAPTEPPSTPRATPPGVDPNLEFGRPVSGKRGLVYPPGSKESAENMVDVSDFKTGQIVRDPRTGKLFRVP